jgi:2-methylcitrate dehydratase PrpD
MHMTGRPIDRLLDFATTATFPGLSAQVQHQAHRTVLDTLGAMVAGGITPTVGITACFARTMNPGGQCTVIGLGKVAGSPGAAMANACAANALDIDDGFRLAKGHPGAAVIPAALAVAEATGRSGAEFLTAVTVGYEAAMRAGVIWHKHLARSEMDFPGTGSWAAMGSAVAAAMLLGLNRGQTEHALGIAEYHAPMAPIMRVVREPSMLKDGIHWGAFVGVSAAQLAAAGFTATRSIFSFPESEPYLETLGTDWWIHRLYIKFFPCCRWAQPPVAAILQLREAGAFDAEEVDQINVETFEAATHLRTIHPRSTEEAQYSLPFPVAAAAVRGRVGPEEVAGDGLTDPAIRRMAERVRMQSAPDLEARFPKECLARVRVTLKDGRELSAGPIQAPGDADQPSTDAELVAKFRGLAASTLHQSDYSLLERAALGCAELASTEPITDLLARVRLAASH